MNESAINQSSLGGLVFKIFGGFLGGTIGTGILLIIFTLSSSVLKPVLDKNIENDIPPIFLVIFIVMIFISSLSANLISNLLMGISEKDKYKRISTTLFQTFLLNLVIFIFSIPLYFLIGEININAIIIIAGLQVILSVLASSIILELISTPTHGLIGIYSGVFGIIIGIVLNQILYQLMEGQASLLLFIALPILWTSIGLMNGLFNLLYFQLYKFYGVDFLSSSQNFGVDEEKEVTTSPITEEEIYENTTKDEKGSEFLKK